MHGEPGVHVEMYARSSSVSSPVSIDSSCGSEYSTPLGSPDDDQCQSGVSARRRQQKRASHVHTVAVDTDAGDS